MAQDLSTSITRRSLVAGLALSAAPVALAGADNASAQATETKKETTSEKSLYERLGGVFAIAAVVDHFSDAVVKNPIVGEKSKNPQLREWHTKNLKRLPGLKFMRTLWVCNVSGGPFQFTATRPGTTPLGLEEAHRLSGSPPQNSMRSQRNSDGRWISPRSRNARRPKSWQPLPPTRTRSQPATSRPPSAAEAAVLPASDDAAQPKLGKALLRPDEMIE
jgi:hemoglobin